MGKHSRVIALKWNLDLKKAAGKQVKGQGAALAPLPQDEETWEVESQQPGGCAAAPLSQLWQGTFTPVLHPSTPPSQLTDDLNLACEAPRCPAPGGVSSVESSPWQLIFLCLFLGFVAGTCVRVWCGVWLLQLCLILLDVFYFPVSLLEVLLPTV